MLFLIFLPLSISSFSLSSALLFLYRFSALFLFFAPFTFFPSVHAFFYSPRLYYSIIIHDKKRSEVKGCNHGKKGLTVEPKKANKPEIWTCLSLKYSNLQMNKVKSINHEVKEPRKDLKIQDLELKSVLVIQLSRNRNSTSSSVSARNKFQRQFWLEDGAIVQISVEATVLESERALGVEILTLHVSGGTKMLKEALNVVKDTKIELVGVTVLTSMSNKDLSKLGIARWTKSQVILLAKLAKKIGLNGIVCSAVEAD